MPLSIGDLIEVRPFPAVVQSADVRELRWVAPAVAAAAIDDFVGGYLGHDERSYHALGTALRALAGTRSGGAYFINGVFGSGKSHLLGLLALLSDGRGHAAFGATHGELATCLDHLPARLVVHFSLDDYDAARFSLEEVFWRELRAEWARRKLPAVALELPPVGSRGEDFAVLEAALAAHQLDGLVVCIDELALFLGARPAAARHSALQGDALFLQFLGQRAARTPLWIFAALQKTVEDIGEIETYALSQIRDRFTVLPLGLAHLPALIERRLIARRDAAALRDLCQSGFEALSRALPLLDFGRAEYLQLYPFYPATIALLEQVVARFFSRTRSAVQFCVQALDPAGAAGQPVLPGALFDYFEPELAGHPDLRPLAEVWQSWQASLPELAPDPIDAAMLRRLMQGLLLFKIAGVAPSVRQLANALAFDAGLADEGNYVCARHLLERLRARGSFVVVERHDDAAVFADRYAIDFGTRVAEMARRHTRSLLQTLPAGDARVARHVLATCHDAALPLAQLENSEPATVMWRNTPRRCEIVVHGAALTPATLANRLAALAQPGHAADMLLCLVPPFARGTEQICAALLEAARASVDSAPDSPPGGGRWRNALVLWTPRAPTHDEIEQAREGAAQHLLEGDPALQDNRRGRAILQHVKAEAGGRNAALARLGMRLLHEGQLCTGGGMAIDAAELAGIETWAGALEAIADFALPTVFPGFEPHAPRLRLLTPSNSEALCLEILRRPLPAPYFNPAHERLVRAIAEPLGMAQAVQGRWQILPPHEAVAAAVRSAVPEEGTSLSSLEAVLAKGEFGLVPEQTALVVCGMLRQGQLAACDARGAVLTPAEIGLPLRRAVHSLRPGRLAKTTSWERVREITSLLLGSALPPISFPAQEEVRTQLFAWREEMVAEIELTRARLMQLRRSLGHSPVQWTQSGRTVEEVEQLLRSFEGSGGAAEWLERVAAIEIGWLKRTSSAWRRLAATLEERQAVLLELHAFLVHPELMVPPALADDRAALLVEFEQGEALLENDELLPRATLWREQYQQHYAAWHAAQHEAARFAVYRRMAASDALRALDRLASLQTHPFPQAQAVREAMTEELDKGCARDGRLHPGEPVCASCRLRLGDRLALRNPAELEAMLDGGVELFRRMWREDAVRQYLQEHDSPLLGWDGEAPSLLPLLTQETLRALDAAARPRRRVVRSSRRLTEALKTCRTRAACIAAFEAWLAGDDGWQGDDEVEWQD